MSDIRSAKLEQLIVYPVKSLRGITVDDWPISEQGLAFDRHWMLVMPNGRFVTQRQLPQMALIDTAIEGSQLILSRTGHGAVSVPLQPTLQPQADTQHSENNPFVAQVWRDQCDVEEACTAASSWLNQVLQPPQPLRLVRMRQGAERPQSQPQRFGADTRVQFADAAPFLIANQASLQALNNHLADKQIAPRDMRRFRPNLIISGLDAFAEHTLDRLDLNGVGFDLIDHCERCIITTIDPDTAAKEPDMQTYRELAQINPMPNNSKAPAFGVNATLRRSGTKPQHIRIV